MTAPTLTRREVLWRRTYAEVLDAAIAQARAGGPGAVSLRAIAAEMGVTPPALYRYVKSADVLMAAVTTRFMEELLAEVDRAGQGSEEDEEDHDDGDRAVAAALAKWPESRPGEWAVVSRPGSPIEAIVVRALREFAGGAS